MSIVDEDTSSLPTRELALVVWRGVFGGWDPVKQKRVVGVTEKIDRLWWIAIVIAALLVPGSLKALGANTNAAQAASSVQHFIAEKILHGAAENPP